MPELIDANVLKSELCYVCDMHDACVTVCETIRIINKQHTIKAKPMRHGKGCEYCKGRAFTNKPLTVTTRTMKRVQVVFNFCPKCGRKMNGGADNGFD